MTGTPDESAVFAQGLSKAYGDRLVVDKVDISVPKGSLSGFVGPNGAGKTTTLRMLLGLIKPTAGQAWVLGHPIDTPSAYLHQVGAMIEGPTFHPGLSGRRNLDRLARLRRVARTRVDAVLEQVGLTGRGNDPFQTYSLGMKQRLGIAAALLPAPDLIILDEPTNGLDPAGIREIRSLLQTLATEGMTVLVSSHLLAEVEQVCDHLVMIRSGRLLFQGHVTELLAAEEPEIVLLPEQDLDAPRLLTLLARAGCRVTPRGGAAVVRGPADAAASLNRIAMNAGITLRGLTVHRPTLENAFLAATGGLDGDLIPAARAGDGLAGRTAHQPASTMSPVGLRPPAGASDPMERRTVLPGQTPAGTTLAPVGGRNGQANRGVPA